MIIWGKRSGAGESESIMTTQPVDDEPQQNREKPCIQSFRKRIHGYLLTPIVHHRPVLCDRAVWVNHPRSENLHPAPLPRTSPNPRTTALSPPRDNLAHALGLYLRCVGPKRTLSGKALPADVAVERPVLHALQLRVMVPEVLLQVRQLDEGAAAVRKVAFVGALTCGGRGNTG